MKDLAQLVESLPRPRIAVVGDLMLDRHVAGECVRVSQEAPVPVLDLAHEASEALGGAANAAAKAAALGAEVRLVGLVGSDPEARCVRALLDAAGLDAGGLVEDAARPTTVKTRYLARGQQVLRADRENRASAAGEMLSRLAEAARDAASDSDAVLLSDYAKGALAPEVLAVVMKAAGEKKVAVTTLERAEKLTGLRAGGISPLALLHKGFEVYLDESALMVDEIFISGGQWGLQIAITPQDMMELTHAHIAEMSA